MPYTLEEIERRLYITNDPAHALFVQFEEEIQGQIDEAEQQARERAYDEGYQDGYQDGMDCSNA